MRRLAFLPCVLALACAGRVAGETAVDQTAPPEPVSGRPLTEGGPEALEAGGGQSVTGVFENSSCADRKYLRRIKFLEDGSFTALDAVAPCPEGAQCVWSGIIHWRGTWKMSGDVIQIIPEFSGTEKRPETVPAEFVVLSRAPVALGEKMGDVVCPYQRKS